MRLIAIFLFLNITIAYAQEVIPGLIPRFYSIPAASDLEISPELAHDMALRGEDISLLEPKSGTNIFEEGNSNIIDAKFITTGQGNFHGLLASRIGIVRFTITNEKGEFYNVYLSKKVHNYLLRKNILEKIGYKVPGMQWMPKLKINFNSTIDKTLFVEEMKDELLADPKRWIVGQGNLHIELQDALVLPAHNNLYNLALGIMPSSIHRGRRLLRSSYVALSLVDTPESANLFSWQAGRVVLNQIKLNHTSEIKNTFDTSFEDAKWIARKIAKLSRDDLWEVVVKAHYPKPVARLLFEKIVQRRNHLLEILQIDKEFSKLPINAKVSEGSELVNGELTVEFFDGYSSRFSFGDPESPFSNSELGAFALSRGQSEILNAGITRFNKLISTNTEEFYKNKLKEIVQKDGIFFPTQAVLVPNISGNMILSRDIVTGSYLGTDNKVQLVDNFGFNLDAGMIMGVEGLPSFITLRGGAGIVFQRMFSHVKPIQSLKKAMREPYKNMAVPLLIDDLASKINKLTEVENSEGQELLLNSVINQLKNSLGIGESFIVTDSVAPNISAQIGFNLSSYLAFDSKLLKIYADINAAKIKISRLHIHRKSENELHVYQDDGSSLRLSLSLRLNSYIPILGVQARWHHAKAQTQFFPMSLRTSETSVATLKALRKSLLTLSGAPLKAVMNPHRIKHNLGEFGSTIKFLFFKSNKIGSNHSINVAHAEGGREISLYRRYDAKTSGRDFEGFITETINEILSNVLKWDYNLSNSQVLNPGFTIGGKAKNKIFVSESDGENFHTEYLRVLNGWSVGQKKLRKYLADLNREYGRKLFDPLSYQNTNLIMLYQLQIQLKMDDRAIKRITALSSSQIAKLIKKYSIKSLPGRMGNAVHSRFALKLKKIKANLTYNPQYAFKKWHDFLDDFLEQVSIQGLIEAAGAENIVAFGQISGFRSGDEGGDSPILSDIYGELPPAVHSSISGSIIQKIGILEGKLLAGWLTERAI